MVVVVLVDVVELVLLVPVLVGDVVLVAPEAARVEVAVLLAGVVVTLVAAFALAVDPGISVATKAPIVAVPRTDARATQVVVRRTRRAT